MEKVRDKKKFICRKQRRIAEIEVFDGCNAKCVVCPRGLGLISNPNVPMDFDLFKQIIDKCVKLNVEGVALFNWGDPLLHKDLAKFCEYAHERMEVYLSTNLCMKADFQNILKNITSMSISVSGFNQNTYEINHRGLNIERVKKNIKIIEGILRNLNKKPYIELKWFDYPYNKGELDLWKNFLDLDLINIYVVKGNFDPILNNEKIKNGEPFTNEDEYMGRVFTGGYKEKLVSLTYCNYVHKFTIDIKGRLLLCCEPMYDERMVIGDFLKDDINEMQIKKLLHRQCIFCDVNINTEQLNLLRKKELEAIKNKTFL